MSRSQCLVVALIFVLSSCVTRPAILGEPLVVNGERVSDREIERFVIYGPARLRLEQRRVQLAIDDEIDRRADEAARAEVGEATWVLAHSTKGVDMYDREIARHVCRVAADAARKTIEARLRPTDAEFEDEYARTIDEFKKKYPFLDTADEICRAYRSVQWHRDNLRQTMLFDRVFYPEDPANWPITTVEAVRADSGDTLIQDAEESYKVRRAHAQQTGEPMAQEDAIYTQMMRQIVRDAMFRTIDFKTSIDGIPDDIALWADKNGDGKPELVVTTDEMWKEIAETVSPTEIEQAKQWFVTSMATRERLKSEGSLLSDRDWKQVIFDLEHQFEGTYFNIDVLATQTYYFPSTEAYKTYFRLLESFKRKMEPTLQPQADGRLAQPLLDHLPRANEVMGLGQVDVEVMLVSAFDIPHFKWKPDGWPWAKRQADKIRAELDTTSASYDAQRTTVAKVEGPESKPANEPSTLYRFWSHVMDEHSEYWDPPGPEGNAHPPADVGMKNRGRFGPRYRNDLQGFIGETPFTVWTTGHSITDFAFFDQPVGTVGGPFKGPLGYYLTYVKGRTPPTRPLNLGDPKHVDLLKDDYLRQAFGAYAKDAVAKANVKGLRSGS